MITILASEILTPNLLVLSERDGILDLRSSLSNSQDIVATSPLLDHPGYFNHFPTTAKVLAPSKENRHRA